MNTPPPSTNQTEPGTDAFEPDETVRLQREDPLPYRTEITRRGSLVIIAGAPADVGNHVVIGDSVVIGREQGCLPVRDGRVSRRHAVLECHDGAYWIRDLGSTNGTRVNGRPVCQEPCRLTEGDHIVLGGTVIKFTLVDHTEANYLSEVERLVGTDALTGLMAKHRFDSALTEALRIARLMNRPLSMLMMDMDGLKKVNDTYGHQAGSYTISHVGRLIAQILHGRGEACRFGGDEFSAYLPGKNLNGAVSIGEHIRQAVEQAQLSLGEARFSVTISIGAAELLPHTATTEQLLALADQALYRAKLLGRNRVSP